MISVFRNNDVINFFLLLPYAIILRLYSLLNPQKYQVGPEDTIVAKWLFGMMDPAIVQSIVAILLVYGQAVLINLLANNHRLHRLPSALSGMVFIYLVSIFKDFQVLTPALIGLTFILFAIMNVFNTYKLSNASPNIFNATFCSALATVIYPPYVFVILALFIGLAMLRNFSWKERVQFLVGFLVLFWIIGSVFFFYDILNWNWLNYLKASGVITDFWSRDITLWTTVSVFFSLILISLFNYYNFMKKKVIDIRKKIDFFYWLILSAFFTLLFFASVDLQLFLFLAISLSIFISMTFLLIKNKALVELLHIAAVVGVFYHHFS